MSYEHWTTEQLELAVEYRERVLLREVEVLYPIGVEYLQEFGAMIVALSERRMEESDG